MNRPARRHHYLSRFLMRRFSERPDSENPPIWKLDKATGKPSRTSINSDAVVKDLYRLEEVPGLEATQIEKDLAKIEGIAAVHLDGLLAGGNLSEVERFELVSYLNLQHRRTPRGRQWFVEIMEVRLGLPVALSNFQIGGSPSQAVPRNAASRTERGNGVAELVGSSGSPRLPPARAGWLHPL